MSDTPAILTRAAHLIALNRCEDALRLLADSAGELAEEPETHLLMARALLGLERSREALQAAARAARLAPDTEQPHRLRAAAFTALRRHDEAIDAATRSVSLAPNLWSAHTQYAFSAVHEPAFHRLARQAADRAVELAPHEPLAHYAVALVARATGRPAESVKAYRRVLALDPSDAVAHNDLAAGHPWWRVGRQVTGFTRALMLDPQLEASRANIERMAPSMVVVIAFGGLICLGSCILVLSTGGAHEALARAVIGVVLIGVPMAGSALTWRRLSRGLRVFLWNRTRRNRALVLSLLPLTLLLALAAVIAFGPPRSPAVSFASFLVGMVLASWSVQLAARQPR